MSSTEETKENLRAPILVIINSLHPHIVIGKMLFVKSHICQRFCVAQIDRDGRWGTTYSLNHISSNFLSIGLPLPELSFQYYSRLRLQLQYIGAKDKLWMKLWSIFDLIAFLLFNCMLQYLESETPRNSFFFFKRKRIFHREVIHSTKLQWLWVNHTAWGCAIFREELSSLQIISYAVLSTLISSMFPSAFISFMNKLSIFAILQWCVLAAIPPFNKFQGIAKRCSLLTQYINIVWIVPHAQGERLFIPGHPIRHLSFLSLAETAPRMLVVLYRWYAARFRIAYYAALRNVYIYKKLKKSQHVGNLWLQYICTLVPNFPCVISDKLNFLQYCIIKTFCMWSFVLYWFKHN